MAVDIGHGTAFKRGNADGPPETYTTVASAISLDGPGLSRDTIDVTTLDSPERFREYIAGVRDGGEVVVEINFDPGSTDVANAFADFKSNDARSYRIQWADGTTFDFKGFLTELPTATPLEDKMTASLTYKVTGEPTYTQA